MHLLAEKHIEEPCAMTYVYFSNGHLHNIKATPYVHSPIYTLIQSVRIMRGHRIMNNSRGLPTNQQAHLQENKQYLAWDFNKWKALPVNQVKVLQSVSSYL